MPEALRFSDAEKASFRSTYAPHASDDHFNLFIQECERRALVPGTHVVFQTRKASEWNAALGRKVDTQKVTLITTINALRLIAERSGKYDGHGPFVYYYMDGDNLRESKIPLGKVPHAVSVEGFRKDWKAPLFATARYAAYAQMRDIDGEKKPTAMWAAGSGRAEEMLAKCCEALMLKTVSPEECAGLLLSEEVGEEQTPLEQLKDLAGHSTGPVTEEQRRYAIAEIPKATVAPKVNQDAALLTAPCDGKPASLFTETNRPDPKDETRVFDKPLPVDPLLKKALDESKPGETVTVGPALPSVAEVKQAISIVAAAASETIVAAATGDVPCDSKKYSVFINERASKIIRDKLPKAGLRDQAASTAVKYYLLKGANKTALNKISEADFERLLSVLESATSEEAAKIVTAVK